MLSVELNILRISVKFEKVAGEDLVYAVVNFAAKRCPSNRPYEYATYTRIDFGTSRFNIVSVYPNLNRTRRCDRLNFYLKPNVTIRFFFKIPNALPESESLD